MWHYNKIFIYLYLSLFGLLNLHTKHVMYFTLISRNHNEYQITQSRSCLIYQEHEVEFIFYSSFIDSLTPLIIFFSHYHNEIKNHMCLFIYLSKSIIFRTDIYIPVIQNYFIRIGGQINFNELNNIRSRYLWFSIWITHTHLFCKPLADLVGELQGCSPAALVGKFYPQKVILVIFRAITPTPPLPE